MLNKKNSKISKPVALFRVDAGPSMGSGHVMRCLALALAWQKQGGRAVFLCAEIPDSLKLLLTSKKINVEMIPAFPGSAGDAETVVHRVLLMNVSCSWIVIDGYQFDSYYLDYLHRLNYRILLLDDFADRPAYPVTAVLNQNDHAPGKIYGKKVSNLFSGVKYCLLRPEFLKSRGQIRRKDQSKIKRVLITLGGSDPVNATAKILEALKNARKFKLDVKAVIGQANPYAESLERLAKKYPHKIEVLQNRSDMPDLMLWADVVFSAGGSTCWELACLGVPNLTGILTEHQIHVAQSVKKLGAGRYLGDYRKITSDKIVHSLESLLADQAAITNISRKARTLVDGLGAVRISGWMWAQK